MFSRMLNYYNIYEYHLQAFVVFCSLSPAKMVCDYWAIRLDPILHISFSINSQSTHTRRLLKIRLHQQNHTKYSLKIEINGPPWCACLAEALWALLD